jgi:hypothetical protein
MQILRCLNISSSGAFVQNWYVWKFL